MEDFGRTLIESFGYFGVFFIQVITNATLFFPLPGLVILPVAIAYLNPFLVALVGALGATVGESVGYFVGRLGRKLTENQKNKLGKWIERLTHWSQRFNMFVIIFLFSLIPPLTFDAAALFAGAVKYSFLKFILAAFLGRFIYFLMWAYGLSALLKWLHIIS